MALEVRFSGKIRKRKRRACEQKEKIVRAKDGAGIERMTMKVLVACEFSGTVREAFRQKGHDAWSCDLLPTEVPGQHICGNVLEHLSDGWDLMIAHPPCTYLCSSGMHWTTRGLRDPILTEQALDFVRALLNASIDKIALENPIGCISTRIRKYDQKNSALSVRPRREQGNLPLA